VAVPSFRESQPGAFDDRMTGNITKICAAQDKSAVEVRRKNAKMLDFRRISMFVGLSGRLMGHADGQKP